MFEIVFSRQKERKKKKGENQRSIPFYTQQTNVHAPVFSRVTARATARRWISRDYTLDGGGTHYVRSHTSWGITTKTEGAFVVAVGEKKKKRKKATKATEKANEQFFFFREGR